MSLYLMKGERILWKSFPGKRFRMFILTRDLALTALFGYLLHYALTALGQDFISGSLIWKIILCGVVFGFIMAGANQISFLFTRYYITNDRLIIKRGFISRKLTSIKHENIHDTKVHQSIFERGLRCGNVYVFTANDSNVSEDDQNPLNKVPCLKQIDDPFKIHNLLSEVKETDDSKDK